jgi:hypothetical protein
MDAQVKDAFNPSYLDIKLRRAVIRLDSLSISVDRTTINWLHEPAQRGYRNLEQHCAVSALASNGFLLSRSSFM